MISQKALSINGDSFSPLLLTCTLFLKLYSIIKVILFIDLFTCLFSHHLNVHSSEPCLNYFQQYPWDLEDCQAHWWVLKNHLLNRRIKRKELYLCMILSVTRSTYSGCWLFTGGSGGGYIPHLPCGTPTRGQGKGKLHLFHIDPCTSHAFLTFLVDGQSQLGQLKSTLTTQQQEPDLWESFPTLVK